MYYLPYEQHLISKAKELRKNLTLAEKKLWYDYLANFQFRVYKQKPINNFIVDFYCPKLKLVIEIDGETHDTEKAQNYDQFRTKILEEYGLKVIRFTNEEVLTNLEGVVVFIEGLIDSIIVE